MGEDMTTSGLKNQVTFVLIIMSCLITIVLIFFSVGLAYDTINKDLDETAKREGLHNGPPGFTFIIFPSVYKTLSFNGLRVRIH